MLRKIFIYLIGAHYYYPYLFFKNVNKDTTPKIASVIYSAKNIGIIIASLYYLISNDTTVSSSEWLFSMPYFVLGILLSYLLFIKAGLADYLVSFFEENFSKKLIFVNYIYVFTIDILSVILLINALPKLP